MHPNPAFRTETAAQNVAFARDRAFGVLAVSTDATPMISHVPFLLSEDATLAELHLVRSNPIVRALKQPQAARIAISEPDGYVSPDWHEIDEQVPTWNYVAVHLTGALERRPQDELPDSWTGRLPFLKIGCCQNRPGFPRRCPAMCWSGSCG